jgi:hypothetical protein
VQTDLSQVTSTTFDFTLSITGNGGAVGFLQSFSTQYFSQNPTSLSFASQPGTWTVLQVGKSNNCSGNATGSFCADDSGSSSVDISASAGTQVWDITGTYGGSFPSSTASWNLQLFASSTSTGTANNALSISQTISGSAPDGGVTVMLLGGVLVGLETLRRKARV